METITVNGVEYVEKAKVLKDTEHVIVIAHRGWIFIGYKDKTVTDKIVLKNANVVRKWTNGRGIGGLTKREYKDEYTLDFAGAVEFSNDGAIAILKCEW